MSNKFKGRLIGQKMNKPVSGKIPPHKNAPILNFFSVILELLLFGAGGGGEGRIDG